MHQKKYLLNIYKNITNRLLQYNQYSSNAVQSRQKELMARGLPKQKPIEGVKHIILVSSGKGGVGKSTTAVNLSTALKLIHPDKNIGLLDTDVFGPTVPLMMNLHETPFLTDKNLMEPLVNYGVKWHICCVIIIGSFQTYKFMLLFFMTKYFLIGSKVSIFIPKIYFIFVFVKDLITTFSICLPMLIFSMSFGFLIEEGSPVIWRGLMVMQALEKLMRQVDWGEIDYLIVDTPPGTGDTHLSLIQNLPVQGVVLVTTPQTAALQVTKRGAIMYKKLNIPLIGLIENMSTVTCPSCSNTIRVFGDGTRQLAEELQLEILESFPLSSNISDGGDNGTPIVLDQNTNQSVLYKNLAKKVVEFLANTEIE